MSELKGSEDSGAGAFRRFVNAVYWTGAVIACLALVLVSAVIPWAVYTRYVLNSAASWPEPMAVLLTRKNLLMSAGNSGSIRPTDLTSNEFGYA